MKTKCKKQIVSFLLCLVMVFTSIQLPTTAVSAAQMQPEEWIAEKTEPETDEVTTESVETNEETESTESEKTVADDMDSEDNVNTDNADAAENKDNASGSTEDEEKTSVNADADEENDIVPIVETKENDTTPEADDEEDVDLSAETAEDDIAVTAAADGLPDDPKVCFPIKNGNFAYGLENWELKWIAGENGKADLTYGDESAVINIENLNSWTGLDLWTLIMQQECKIYAGYTYEVSFDVTSSINRKIKSGFESTKDDSGNVTWDNGGYNYNGENITKGITDLKANKLTHVSYEFDANMAHDMNGFFMIHIGTDLGNDAASGAHTITVSNVKFEMKGARDKFIQMEDDFSTQKDNAAVTDGAIDTDSKYLKLDKNGKIVYTQAVNMEKDKEYIVSFAARKNKDGGDQGTTKVKASLTYADGTTGSLDQEISDFTVRYRLPFTPSGEGTATLTIEADNPVYLDNIGIWIKDTAEALGTIFPRPDIMLITPYFEAINVQKGNDVAVFIGYGNEWRVPDNLDITIKKVDGTKLKKNQDYKFYANLEGPIEDYVDRVNGEGYESAIVIKDHVFDAGAGLYTFYLESSWFEKAKPITVEIMENNLVNGDFGRGFYGWNAFCNEINSTAFEINHDRNYFRMAANINFINDLWAENGVSWHTPWKYSISLSQKNIMLEKDNDYVLTFAASSTVKRPISIQWEGVTIKSITSSGQNVLLGTERNDWIFYVEPEEKTYTVTLNAPSNDRTTLNFNMGAFAYEKGQTGYQYDEFVDPESHTVYISDCCLLKEGEVNDYTPIPGITGVYDGRTYYSPVSVLVNYKKDYTLELIKDGEAVNYTPGDIIKDDGKYTVTATDQENQNIKNIVNFTIERKDKSFYDNAYGYVVLSNKATGRVLDLNGTKAGRALKQSTYRGEAGQIFSLERAQGSDNDDTVVIRSLATGLVVDISSEETGSHLMLNEQDYTEGQSWFIDRSVPQGYVKFINKATNKVLSVGATGWGCTKSEGMIATLEENSGYEDEEQQSKDPQRWDIIEIQDDLDSMLRSIWGDEVDVSTQEKWQQNALVAPVADKLNPAGCITVEFYPWKDAASYDIYLDKGTDKERKVTVTKDQIENAGSKDKFMKTEDGTYKIFGTMDTLYSTEVGEHKLTVEAKGAQTVTKEISFFLSKKGVGWSTLHRNEDLNLSWYYHWAAEPAIGTDKDLEFVPMLWSYVDDSWIQNEANKKYGTVLTFNEPDWSDQSNVPVTVESATAWMERYNASVDRDSSLSTEDKEKTKLKKPYKSVDLAWPHFMNSGLRVGSPATAIPAPSCNGVVTMNDVDGPDTWWFDYMDLMQAKKNDGWDYDFVAIHSYNAECDAKGFLAMVDATYKLTRKPIWITEFGVASWNQNAENWPGSKQKQVIEFMTEVINGLEERDYVERYAWFPFNPNDAYGGASGIFDYTSGELNELGQVYAQLGIPEGYKEKDTYASYSAEIPKICNIEASQTILKIGEIANLSITKGGNPTWNVTGGNNVIKVDAAGNVEALAEGTATVEVTTSEGYRNTITLTVEKPKYDSVAIQAKGGDGNTTNIDTLEVGDTVKVSASPSSNNERWESSDPFVVRIKDVVTENYTKHDRSIIAGNPGVTLLTATVDGTDANQIIIVYEKGQKPEGITAKIASVPESLVVGETAKLTANVTPSGTSYTWKSEMEDIAVVDETTGEVKAVGAGTALISLYTTNGVPIAAAAIPVKAKKQFGVSIDKSELAVGDTAQITVISAPEGPQILYSSSNREVADVDDNGKVTAKSEGTAVITVKAGDLTQTVSVTVKSEEDLAAEEKAKLNILLISCNALREKWFTEDTWAVYKEKWDAAKAVSDKDNATANEVRTAYNELVDAMGKLEMKDSSMEAAIQDALQKIEELREKLKEIETNNTYVKDNYTEDSWSKYEEALKKVQELLSKIDKGEDYNPQDVVNVYNQFMLAINSLVKKGNGNDGNNGNNGNNGQNGQNAKITISISKTSILQNETAQCTVLGDGNVTYTSDKPSVATVDAKGLVTGVSAGTATITATSAALGCTASVVVTVVKPTVRWNVSYKTVPLQLKNGKKVNKTTALMATGLQPGDSIQSVKSSKTKIATVKKGSKGKVTITPKKVGKTTITVTTKYGATAKFTLKVQKKAVKVTKLTVDNPEVKKKKLTLKKGKSLTLKVTKKYITALDKITYSTNKKSVATVSSKGKITAKKKGKAKITVKCGKKKVVITVTVK